MEVVRAAVLLLVETLLVPAARLFAPPIQEPVVGERMGDFEVVESSHLEVEEEMVLVEGG